jgi:hypothetical protein
MCARQTVVTVVRTDKCGKHLVFRMKAKVAVNFQCYSCTPTPNSYHQPGHCHWRTWHHSSRTLWHWEWYKYVRWECGCNWCHKGNKYIKAYTPKLRS